MISLRTALMSFYTTTDFGRHHGTRRRSNYDLVFVVIFFKCLLKYLIVNYRLQNLTFFSM